MPWGDITYEAGEKANNTFFLAKKPKKLFLEIHVVEIALDMCNTSISDKKKKKNSNIIKWCI